MPYTSIRPTYIYGPLNYNPLEEYFFERLDQDRTVIVPGEAERRETRVYRANASCTIMTCVVDLKT